MIRRLFAWFRRAKLSRNDETSRDLSPSFSGVLEKRRADLRAAADAAERRGDDRALGFYRMQLQQATHDALRAAR